MVNCNVENCNNKSEHTIQGNKFLTYLCEKDYQTYYDEELLSIDSNIPLKKSVIQARNES